MAQPRLFWNAALSQHHRNTFVVLSAAIRGHSWLFVGSSWAPGTMQLRCQYVGTTTNHVCPTHLRTHYDSAAIHPRSPHDPPGSRYDPPRFPRIPLRSPAIPQDPATIPHDSPGSRYDPPRLSTISLRSPTTPTIPLRSPTTPTIPHDCATDVSGCTPLNKFCILTSPTVFKTKRKNIDRYITFYFLLYLLSIVQVSRELLSSQWKPPSFLVETVTLKSSHFGKRPYAWNQIRTTFSGPSVSKILRVGSQGPPGHDYCTSFTQSLKWMGLKSLFYRKIWGHTLYDKQLGAWIPHYLVGCTF